MAYVKFEAAQGKLIYQGVSTLTATDSILIL